MLEAGDSVTDDLGESCERRHWIGRPLRQIMPLSPALALEPTSACEHFRQESTELIEVRRIVARYFNALEDLSHFNTMEISGPAGVAGINAGTAGKLSAVYSDSTGKLASVLTQAMTEHYRQGKTVELLREADGSVSAILTGIEQIIGSDYMSLLKEEERSNAGTFREASLGQSSSMVLLLNRAYRQEVASGQRRSKASAAYVSALREIVAGHAQLAKLGAAKPATVTAALAPHIAELQRLLPVLKAVT